MAALPGGLNPEMLKSLMPVLAGAGFREFTASVEKLMKALGSGEGKGPGHQAAGPQGAGMPTGMPPAPPASPPGAAPGQPGLQSLLPLIMMLRQQGGAQG